MMIREKTSMVRTQKYDVDYLNAIFTPLSYEERLQKLYELFPTKEILVTSSFGTKSVFILHLLNKLNIQQKIYFINTTYHFPETLEYKDQLTDLFNLDVEEVLPNPVENRITREQEWWKDHPKMCCSVNKVIPLEPIKAKYSIWMSSVMAYQTKFRAGLRVFEEQGDLLKFHPLIDIDEAEFLYQMGFHELPKHPLEAKGYGSVGCEHCTAKGEGRAGRWKGKAKQECGLHPGYFLKKAQEKKKNNES